MGTGRVGGGAPLLATCSTTRRHPDVVHPSSTIRGGDVPFKGAGVAGKCIRCSDKKYENSTSFLLDVSKMDMRTLFFFIVSSTVHGLLWWRHRDLRAPRDEGWTRFSSRLLRAVQRAELPPLGVWIAQGMRTVRTGCVSRHVGLDLPDYVLEEAVSIEPPRHANQRRCARWRRSIDGSHASTPRPQKNVVPGRKVL